MRVILLVVVSAVLLGVAAGLATTALRMKLSPWEGDPVSGSGDPHMPQPVPPDQPPPRVVVDRPEHDFGVMDFKTQGRHEFIFHNQGDGPLVLGAGETTCRCALSEVQQGEIAPGDSGRVLLTWRAEETPGPYRQSATVFTNDPERPRVVLTIAGRITVAVRVVPAELILSQISADAAASAEVRLLGYLTSPLEVLNYSLADQDTARFFEVALSPLGHEQLRQEPDARSGWLLRVTVKPGLPQGAFQQRILIRTNLESAPEIEVSVKGTIGSDIAVVGRGWDAEEGILTLGAVDRKTGIQRRLMLIVRGPHRSEVRFKVSVPDPKLLRVTLGETTEINNGIATQTPLVIEIPKDAPPVNRMGSAQGELESITVQTNHPKMPALRIRVRFVVEG